MLSASTCFPTPQPLWCSLPALPLSVRRDPESRLRLASFFPQVQVAFVGKPVHIHPVYCLYMAQAHAPSWYLSLAQVSSSHHVLVMLSPVHNGIKQGFNRLFCLHAITRRL